MHRLSVDPGSLGPPTRDQPDPPRKLPQAQEAKVHPKDAGEGNNASIFFVGTATTIIEWEGIRFMTDPNFLHAGDHVHLGPGVTGERRTNPAINLEELPPVHFVLLSHYHADHFDQKVEASLRRNLPIISTPHAKRCLESKGDDSFNQVYDLDTFQSMMVDIKPTGPRGNRFPAFKITAMPGKHVPSGPLSVANDLLGAVPPTNGWMVELGYTASLNDADSFRNSYRIYISGDTVMTDELKQIPERYKDQNIDLMLIHLGGTTIPSPSVPLLMVTMDARQGIELIQLVNPDLTIPVHYDDYDVFVSPLSDFKKAVEDAGLSEKVVYLDRKDMYRFAT